MCVTYAFKIRCRLYPILLNFQLINIKDKRVSTRLKAGHVAEVADEIDLTQSGDSKVILGKLIWSCMT